MYAKWARNGEELFYWDRLKSCIMAVKVTTNPAFTKGNPVPLPVETSVPYAYRHWDVTPDGQRFLILQSVEEEEAESITQINIVLNWFEELKRLVPTP